MNDHIDIPPEDSISCCQDTFNRDRSFVLAPGKNLVTGLPCLYNEGSQSAALRLVIAWQEDILIYLHEEESKSINNLII